MPRIGVLGGMGPAATVDFMAKLVGLTPADRDQDHLPLMLASLPQVPDRSAAILGRGEDPLPGMVRGIRLLNHADVDLVVIPCSTAHHWYDELSTASRAPILHIAGTAVARAPIGQRTLILGTQGALVSGFFQRELAARKTPCLVPSPADQAAVDEAIRLIKAGQAASAGASLSRLLLRAKEDGAQTVILGCTELPLAAAHIDRQDLRLIDCTLELARQTLNYALERGWTRT